MEIEPKIEKSKLSEIRSKIERKIRELLKKEVNVTLKPIKVEVTYKLIKVKTKTGKEKYFTKIEKK